MKGLICDTSSSVCITGILDDENLIAKSELDNGKTHSENFMILVQNSLENANLKLDDIDYFSIVVGPGSFTGIRIGVASLKAMAEVINKKIISIYSLEALAGNEYRKTKNICSLIDARNNQVYFGIFDENLNKLEEFLADDINICLEIVKKYDNVVFVGDGSVLHRKLIETTMYGKNISFSENNKQSAEGLGIITYKKAKESDFVNSDGLIPVYLRKSQAERMKESQC